MIEKDIKILIIDDDDDVLTSARIYLEEHFGKVDIMNLPKNIPTILSNNLYDIILLDMNFEKGETDGRAGIMWLQKILEIHPSTIVILMTAFGDIDLAVKGIKNGAFDFIVKPWKNKKLHASILSALKLYKSNKEITALKSNQKALINAIDTSSEEIIGKSKAIQKVKNDIEKIAATDANVLILGENGTGKELIARSLHKKSLRNKAVFINVDIGTINENLFESELFGHKRGAFTDAKEDKPGRFELASGGTIFLDEIGNLSYDLQAKLLTAIERREISRVGSSEKIAVDIRLISATNMPIFQMVEQGKFRQDLFYRINTIVLNNPSLRERLEDIPDLAEYFLQIYSKKYNKPTLKLTKKIISYLQKHNWPGNIRELRNVMERAVVLSNHNSLNFDEILLTNTNINIPDETLNLNAMEKALLLKALKKNNGNITKAAKDLGIQRNALYRRLEKYGL